MSVANDAASNPTPQDDNVLSAQQVIELASRYLAEGKFDDVEKLADKLLVWREDHDQAWFFKSLVAHARGQLEEALVFLERSEGATELLVSRLLLKGRCLAGLGEIDKALLSFRQALEFQPDNAEGYYWMGMCLRAKNDMTDARSFLRRSTLLDPQLAPAWYEQGNLALLTDRFDEAIKAYRKAANLLPNSHEVLNNLGLAFQGKGDLPAAEESFNSAIAMFPDYAEAYLNLSLVLAALSRDADAKQAQERALALNPELQVVLDNL